MVRLYVRFSWADLTTVKILDIRSDCQSIFTAALSLNGLQVSYAAPGWGSPRSIGKKSFVVNGQPILLREYPRWDNPYTKTAFDSLKCHFEYQGKTLDLSFGDGT